jgi:hypothetical protein
MKPEAPKDIDRIFAEEGHLITEALTRARATRSSGTSRRVCQSSSGGTERAFGFSPRRSTIISRSKTHVGSAGVSYAAAERRF